MWKGYPLPFHTNARPAAVAAAMIYARSGNDAFWATHDAFFADQPHLARSSPRDALARAGAAPGDGWTREAEAKVGADIDAASARAATGTPCSFFNGVFVSGAQPYERFAAIVDDQIQKAQRARDEGDAAPPRVRRADQGAVEAAGALGRPEAAPMDDRAIHAVAGGRLARAGQGDARP